ncbi:MAG: hypothetical protein FJY73_12745 [Candidatus Eisenbacteria bacterium]|nr:hypothetical protein [Candidatus Eisenbacteria bacterium]
MRRTFVLGLGAVALVLIWPLAARGQDFGVEVDLDGQLGNGPDTVVVGAGDSVTAEVWIEDHDGMIIYLLVRLCNHDRYLSFTSGTYMLWGTWEGQPIVADSECVTFEAITFSEPGPPAYHVGSATYTAAVEGATAELSVDLEGSLYCNGELVCDQFAYAVRAYVRVEPGEPTASEQPTWGTIKGLFR